MYRKIVEMGFQVGHYGDDLGCQTGPLVSPKQFRTLILPRLKRLFKVYKDAGLPMILHSCGDISSFIPDLLDIGLDLLEPVQPCMDFEFLKNEYGDRLSFWGGIDTQYILPFGTPDEVKAETRRVISILGKNGGYIIAPSQEVMKDVPLENVVALLEAIQESRTSQ